MPHNAFQYLEEVLAFRASLSSETDRGCALMAGAYLDDQLQRLLRRSLVDDKVVSDKLLGGFGPLGTFSARIDFCYALGLLSPMATRDLHLIRKIRNEFGHTATPLTFDCPSISARCTELYHTMVARPTARGKFTTAALGVCGVIHASISKVQPKQADRGVVITDELQVKTQELTEALIAFAEGDSGDQPNGLSDVQRKVLQFFRERLSSGGNQKDAEEGEQKSSTPS